MYLSFLTCNESNTNFMIFTAKLEGHHFSFSFIYLSAKILISHDFPTQDKDSKLTQIKVQGIVEQKDQ